MRDEVQSLYRQPAATVVVRSRDQLVPDRTWLRSVERNEDRMGLHQDETLLSQYWYGPPRHLVFSMNRATGDRRFNGRERAFLRLFLHEVHALAGSALTFDEAGPFAGLTPRAREVLNALLEGDAEKQIAARFGVSRHTVHDYVKALYRRFGVNSRGELLAALATDRTGRPETTTGRVVPSPPPPVRRRGRSRPAARAERSARVPAGGQVVRARPGQRRGGEPTSTGREARGAAATRAASRDASEGRSSA